jgi:hypothetical protein
MIEKRCGRDVGYRVIAGGLHSDHATIARFRARHEKALGGLFSRVLRLLAAEGMVSLGMLSLDGTKLAGNAAQKANRTLPQIEKVLAEAAAADADDDARDGGTPQPATPRALARRAERRERQESLVFRGSRTCLTTQGNSSRRREFHGSAHIARHHR